MDYTIIIPHKNTSALLERLILSIPIDFDIQIIVVDDNSSEEEFEAIRLLSQRHSFELYKNEGVTAGGARNTGLKYATGKWIIFADSDDYFTGIFKSCLEKYKEASFDIIYFQVESKYSDTLKPAYRDIHVKNIAKLYASKNDDNYLRCCYTVPWGKIYRSSLIFDNNIKFDEVISGNDILFSVKTGLIAKSVIFDDSIFYCVTVSSGSITTIKTVESFESRFQAYLRTNDLLKKMNKKRYRISLLGTLFKSRHYGIRYMIHVLAECIKHRSNLFLGIFDARRYYKSYKCRNH